MNNFGQQYACCGHFWAGDCHCLLWTMAVMSVNVPWCSLHSLHLCSSRHCNALLLAQSPYSVSCSCLLWGCETLPPSGCTSHSPGKFSLQFVKALIDCLDGFWYMSQTRKLQNWSHSVTPWSETWGRSMASPHKRSCGHVVSEHHTPFSPQRAGRNPEKVAQSSVYFWILAISAVALQYAGWWGDGLPTYAHFCQGGRIPSSSGA